MATVLPALGAEVRVHRVRRARLTASLIAAVGLLAAAFVALIAGRLSPALYFLLLTVVPAALLLDLLPLVTRVIRVYEGGLAISTMFGEQTFEWSAVERLFVLPRPRLLPSPTAPSPSLAVRFESGDSGGWFDDDLEGFDEVYRRVRDAVTHNTGEGPTRAWRGGESLWFGPLELSRRELRRGSFVVPLGGVGTAQVRGGVLHLDDEPVWPLARIPNPHLLAAALREAGIDSAPLETTLRLERSEE